MQKKINLNKIEYLESNYLKIIYKRVINNIDLLTTFFQNECIIDVAQKFFINSFEDFEINSKFPNSGFFVKQLHPSRCSVDNKCTIFLNISLETENIDEIHYDINKNIRIDKNFNSYRGLIVDDNCNIIGRYCSYLPMIITKQGTKNNRTVHSREIYLSYCIKILYDYDRNIHAIILFCVPNGNLSNLLEKGIIFSKENSILSPISPINEKDLFFNKTDVLFRYANFCKFNLKDSVNKLNTEIYRLKIVYLNEGLDKNIYKNPIFLEEYKKLMHK